MCLTARYSSLEYLGSVVMGDAKEVDAVHLQYLVTHLSTRDTNCYLPCFRHASPTTHLDSIDGCHGAWLHKGHIDPQSMLNPTANAEPIPITHLEEEVDLQGGAGQGRSSRTMPKKVTLLPAHLLHIWLMVHSGVQLV